MGFLENLTNDAFANKMADHYHTHIGAAGYKSIRAEAGDNPQTPAWGAQPYLERGMRGDISQLTAPAFDSIRIGGFMTSPKGLLFIAKQAGLQRSNPRGEYPIPGVNPGRSYNAPSTLAQVLLGPLGIHIDRHGNGSLNIEANNYEARIKAKNNPQGLPTANRLVSIARDLKLGYHKDLNVSVSSFAKHDMDKDTLESNRIQDTNFYKKRTRVINKISGKGGANSLFGLGFTNIRTSTATGLDGLINISYKYGKSYKDQRFKGEGYVGAFGPLIDELGDDFNPTGPYELDPQSVKAKANSLAKYKTLDYGGIVKAGKATNNTTNIKSFTTKGDDGEALRYDSTDSINAYTRLGLIDYGTVSRLADEDAQYDKYGEGESLSDYITFKLKSDTQTVYLRSYGLGTITDNTSFSWSEVKYAGRTMAQHKFDSVARDVSHDLTVVAFNKKELKRNIAKLNLLYQIASPSIDSGSGLASAPLVQLSLGDLYKEQNVIIDKITFTVDEATSWDIEYGETGGAELPMMVKLSLGYKLLTNSDGDFFTNASKYWDAG